MTGTAIVPAAPLARLKPLPILYDNILLSLFAVMLFPDDLALARKLVARLLIQGTLQDVLNTGVRVDQKYMVAILDDLRDGRPDQKLTARRRYWASACGQVIKVLFALINANDVRVREHASWEQAIRIAEREIGRTQRGNRSSLSVQRRRFAPVLHVLGAFEIARDEGSRPPLTAEALLHNAMVLHAKLWDWHVRRHWRGARNRYLEQEIFWRWPDATYDASGGVPDIAIPFDRLVPYGEGGRPRKHR